MNPEQEKIRALADRVAGRISGDPNSANRAGESSTKGLTEDIAALRSGMSEIQKRLTRIESQFHQGESSGASPYAESSLWQTTVAGWHPSQQKFGVQEAAVSELVDYLQGEKQCELEPGGKPCDHCSMCSSRGF